MGKIYVGQVLDIELDTGDDLTGAVAPVIRAVKPDGSVVEWPAPVSGTALTYRTTGSAEDIPGDLDQSGVWRLQAVPDIPGLEAPGETVTMKVWSFGS